MFYVFRPLKMTKIQGFQPLAPGTPRTTKNRQAPANRYPQICRLDARWGALKRPPSRASFRRTVVPTLRRAEVPMRRNSAAQAQHRSKSELKPKTSEELKPKTPELQSKSSGLKRKPQSPKAKTSRLKPRTQS